MVCIATPHYGTVRIPPGINDLNSFRQWIHFAALPEKLPIHFLQGDVWVDSDRADSVDNVMIRGALIATVYGMVTDKDLGHYFTAGMLWSNDQAGFATVPDGGYISNESLRTGRVRFSDGGNPKAKATEIIGTLDLVIELITDVSEEKDTDWLMSAYAAAGVPEYWLIDARGKRLRFDILTLRRNRYATTRHIKGWVRSKVLQKNFRLTRSKRQDNWPEFDLEVR